MKAAILWRFSRLEMAALPPILMRSRNLLVLLGFMLLLNSCGSDGSSGTISPLIEPSQERVRETIRTILDLYSTAMRQEDIDRLQELLLPADTSTQSRTQSQVEDDAFIDAATFRQTVTDAFRRLAFLDLQYRVREEDIQVEADTSRVVFTEVESVLDPDTLEQRTRSFRTTFRLIQEQRPLTQDMQETPDRTTTLFFITAVRREGPQFEVVTSGQLLAEIPARILVTAPTGSFPLTNVTVTVPETGDVQSLVATAGTFQGDFRPPDRPHPRPLRVHLHGVNGETQTLFHPYRLRQPGDGIVEKIAGTDTTPFFDTTQFFAMAIAPDGTVTAGGIEPTLGAILYQVPFGTTTACLVDALFFRSNLGRSTNPGSRVEDLVYDDDERLHTIVFDKGSDDPDGPLPIIRDFVIEAGEAEADRFILCPLVNPQVRLRFCETVNAFDPDQDYPFLVPDPQAPEAGADQLSGSTRAVTAGGGDIWLFGSDGGVARVADSFRDGQCPQGAVEVQYDPIFRRQDNDLQQDNGLPTNSVPAFVVGHDGSLGFGTALGFTLLQPNGQFTPVPFQRQLFVPQEVATLEGFFQEVAMAIFAARPLMIERLGELSFQARFGRALIKEDLIFSAAAGVQVDEEAPCRFWLGTLGGGLRCLDVIDGQLQDTLLLTRAEVVRMNPVSDEREVVMRPGISSNLIFALAVDNTPRNTEEHVDAQTVWAATDEGVSRIHVRNETVTITNFSALDGLDLPVRDVAVDQKGTVWLATEGGLFRIVTSER